MERLLITLIAGAIMFGNAENGSVQTSSQEQSKQDSSNKESSEETLKRMMVNTTINVFDPEVILGARESLSLTQEQIEKLQAISQTAREDAKKVLTDKQNSELTGLDNLPDHPKTMAQMHRKMLQELLSLNAKIYYLMLHKVRNLNLTVTRRDSSIQSKEPATSGRLNTENTFKDRFLQSTLNSLSARNRGTINTYNQMLRNEPFQQSTLNSLSARYRGGINIYNQVLENDPFQQSTLDSLRDR